ncbi:Uncharacterized protein OS=Singulisphaera acidiphila (strain ATCC BAA-1392 / DSM 18658 / VKM B-2454 / MOB10) GN=Sinac_4673 PE=4 SV=1 [Gemmataceae bacterium]|nr:Uncharacterized protein OS=Singulisphaera acidiphila (strain ATCC BAA-1392 / DSM 18658 / VKM B-2454 / MOB10) GN=Sinac_4673 PE=4 SV=1 [Gemmataceae bacterium]VTU00025.1 Uncharacterized protein OS=Singulisphaera acidiphila (strain ATCC BAA-1392 / DSM 18658 / VKM B-2454 / MOB10) GN=Sinac_4673 PE=4 SV=1 [Gemmataceae bacterium]
MRHHSTPELNMADDPILAIWDRLLSAPHPLPTGLASYVLRLGFPDSDRDRMGDLSERAQTGSLSDDERGELEAYCHAAAFLSMLQSKARVALRTVPAAAGNGAPAA